MKEGGERKERGKDMKEGKEGKEGMLKERNIRKNAYWKEGILEGTHF